MKSILFKRFRPENISIVIGCPFKTQKPFICLVNLLMVFFILEVFHINPNFESFSFILAIKKYKTGNHCLELVTVKSIYAKCADLLNSNRKNIAGMA